MPPWRIWSAIAAAWTLLALLSLAETALLFAMQGRPLPLLALFLQGAVCWLVYIPLTPLILWLGERLPLKGRLRYGRLIAHVALALLVGIPYAAAAAVMYHTFATPSPNAPSGLLQLFLGWYVGGLPMMVLAYFAVHMLGRAFFWFARNRASELEAARLGEQLSEARLEALRAQIHPHFLFNALNAVDTLVHDGDADGAGRVVHLLGDLLRESLDESRPATIPLEREVAFVRRYLEIQEVRFPDRLRVSIDVPAALAAAAVPAFVLQPLVENALRHGIGPHRDAGRLAVRAEAGNGSLVLTVDDDGAGPPPGPAATGVGLGNLRTRLAVMYGPAASVELGRNAWGGARAVVRLPSGGGVR